QFQGGRISYSGQWNYTSYPQDSECSGMRPARKKLTPSGVASLTRGGIPPPLQAVDLRRYAMSSVSRRKIMLPDVNISERDQLIPLSIRQRYRCRAPIREHARDLFDILCVVPAARNRLAVCNRCRG